MTPCQQLITPNQDNKHTFQRYTFYRLYMLEESSDFLFSIQAKHQKLTLLRQWGHVSEFKYHCLKHSTCKMWWQSSIMFFFRVLPLLLQESSLFEDVLSNSSSKHITHWFSKACMGCSHCRIRSSQLFSRIVILLVLIKCRVTTMINLSADTHRNKRNIMLIVDFVNALASPDVRFKKLWFILKKLTINTPMRSIICTLPNSDKTFDMVW